MPVQDKTLLCLNAIGFDRPKLMHQCLEFVKELGSVSEGLEAMIRTQHLATDTAKTLKERVQNFSYDRLINHCKKYQIQTLFYHDPNYPELLKQIYYPPLVLFYKGNLNALKKTGFAIVGSRNASSYGKNVTAHFSKVLCPHFTIISGMANGIDTAAHRETLAQKQDTIAVLGHGLDDCYPKRNKTLFLEISQNGLLLSEFPPGVPSLPHHFPQRNRIISGLSKGVLVVEAGKKSGALITAQHAIEHNRDVFAIPGSIFSELSEGCHKLIQDGAKLVTDTKDILIEFEQLFNWATVDVSSISETSSPPELSPTESKLWTELSAYPQHIDELSQRSGLDLSTLLPLLTQWELDAYIESLPGNTYIKAKK